MPIKKIAKNVSAKVSEKKCNLQDSMLNFQIALAQEKDETIDMLATYKNIPLKKASKEDIKAANEQFCDLLKGAGLGAFAILPLAPITLPIIIKLGRKMNIEMLPSSFVQSAELQQDEALTPPTKSNSKTA